MFDFKLTPRDGSSDPVVVHADTGDVYLWEKTHKGKVVSQLFQNKSLVDLYEVAHVAAQRAGVFTDANVDEFARTYSIVVDPDEDEEDPTPPAL